MTAPSGGAAPLPGGSAPLAERLAAVEAAIRDDRHRQPAAVIEAIARHWTAGMTVDAIAAEVGVSPHIVRDRLHRAGALEYVYRNRRRHVREVFARQGPRLIAAYEAGASVQELAARAGISPYTLKAYLVEHGIVIRDPRRRAQEVLEARSAELIAAYRAGATLKELAASAGTSPQQLRKHLLAHGVPSIRHRGRRWPREVFEQRGAELAAEYTAGASLKTVAADAGVHERTLRTFLVSEGIAIRRSSPRLWRIPASRAPELIAAYEAGAPLTALAAEAGVCASTISRFLVGHGARLRHDHGWYRRRPSAGT